MAYGQGSLIHQPERGLWLGVIELAPGADGKRRRKYIRAKSKSVVVARMREAQANRDRGQEVFNDGTTVGAWLEHWVEAIMPTMDLAEKTQTSYRSIVRHRLIPALGRYRLTKLTPEHVEAALMAWREQGLSPGSITLTRSLLRLIVREAEVRGRVGRNVVALTRAPRKAQTKISDALNTEEARAVLQVAKGDRLSALAVLALTVGMRQGEMIRLRWSDVDIDGPAPSLKVVKAKTMAGIRSVALPTLVADALRDHRRRQRIERVAAELWDDPDLVFTTAWGTPLTSREVLRWWHALTIKAGVGRRRFHATRHTAATLMLNNGVPLEVITATLGHAGLAITADIYAKVWKQHQQKAADAMDHLFGATTAQEQASTQ